MSCPGNRDGINEWMALLAGTGVPPPDAVFAQSVTGWQISDTTEQPEPVQAAEPTEGMSRTYFFVVDLTK